MEDIAALLQDNSQLYGVSSSDDGDCRESRKTRILLKINEDTIQSRGDEEFLSNPENELVEFATIWLGQNYSQVQEKGIKYFLHQHPDTNVAEVCCGDKVHR